MIIDAGTNEDSETVKSYISNQGITKLDFVVGTHSHKSTMEKLQAKGIKIYRTDENGTERRRREIEKLTEDLWE